MVYSCAISQTNLVPNPSFEDFIPGDTFCNAGPIDATPPWYSPTGGSPNCFKTCCWNAGWAIPQNATGFQYTYNGIGYAGFGIIDLTGFSVNFREYIQIKLFDSLTENKNYLINFWVSLADSACYATDDIGLYFSDTAISKDIMDYSPFNSFVPQIENPQGNIITDKENWSLISGIYHANGGEQFITIGNFNDDVNTNTINVGGSSNYQLCEESYYYIDDVSVTLIDEDTLNTLAVPNAFTPDGNGKNDVFIAHGKNVKEFHGKIFNRWGMELFELNDLNGGWDGKYNNAYVSAGVYFYIIAVVFKDGTMEEKKGTVQVVR